MNNKKRNQLIGFIVLILIALIFFPYILTNKPEVVTSSVSLLPSTNNDNQIDAVIDDNSLVFTDNSPIGQPDAIVSPPNDLDVSAPEQTITESVTDDKINLTDNKNYIVQLVALKNRQKIDELTALLRLNNYDVYTIPKTPKDGQIIRLLVGNYPTKEQAELVVIDLENLTKLKGFVTTKPN